MSFPRSSPVRRRYSDLPRSPFRDRPSPPLQKCSPQRERSPAHHRRSPAMGSLVRNGSSYMTRSPVREKLRVHTQSPRCEKLRSPAKDKVTNRIKSPKRGRSGSPLKEELPQRTRSPKRVKSRSPTKGKPRQHTGSPSQKQSRSPEKQRPLENARSPKQVHSSASIRTGSSCSPSPRTKRLRRAQVEKTLHRDEGRSVVRGHDKGRNRERGEERNASHGGRLARDKSDVGTSRSSRHAHGYLTSPVDISHRSGFSPHSPSRVSKAAARDEVTEIRDEQHRHGDQDSIAKMMVAEEALETKQKQKPSFELSGKLAEETNRVRGVTLLFTEPPDAQRPGIRWRLYVFKAGEVLNEPLYVHRQSCYLFGRERRVADIPTDHPSCSKQHAVLQYRLVEKEQPDGLLLKQVRPYLMDLGSTNGTFLNDERIEPQRYYELREKDVIKFGNSSREYVVLHENSAK